LKKVLGSDFAVFVLGDLAFKGKLSDPLKKIFDISRGEPRGLIDEPVQTYLADIEPREAVLDNGLSLITIQAADRYYAIESSRAEQCRVQLSDVIGSAYEQHPVGFILE
jgi:hypothetical protein